MSARCRWIPALAAASGVCGAGVVSAAEWSFAPTVGWFLDHDSNRTLLAASQAGESANATLDLDLVRRGERSEFSLRPHLRAQRFSNDVAEDADDARLAVNYALDFERARFTVGSGVARENALTTQLADGGLIEADATRRLIDASVQWHFAHHEARTFFTSLAAMDSRYSGARAGHLTDFRYAALSVGESFNLSTRTSFTVTGFASRLETLEGAGPASEEQGADAGFNFAWTARTSWKATFGSSWRKVGPVKSQGSTRELSLTHRDETRDWSVAYERSLVPFATGVLGERDTARFAFHQAFTPQFGATLSTDFVRNRDVGLGQTRERREYRRAEARLNWQAARTLEVGVLARFTEASLNLGDGDARGWNLHCGATWRPDRRVLGH